MCFMLLFQKNTILCLCCVVISYNVFMCLSELLLCVYCVVSMFIWCFMSFLHAYIMCFKLCPQCVCCFCVFSQVVLFVLCCFLYVYIAYKLFLLVYNVCKWFSHVLKCVHVTFSFYFVFALISVCVYSLILFSHC